MKTHYQFLFAVFACIFCLSCSKQKKHDYVTYEGHVYYKSGEPAINVPVVLDACAGGSGDKQHRCTGNRFNIIRTSTNSSGYFYIREKASRIDYYFVTIGNSFSNADGVSALALKEERFTKVVLAY